MIHLRELRCFVIECCHMVRTISVCCAGCALAIMLVSCGGRAATESRGPIVTVAQSGPADVVGSDSAALQKAAGLLRPGDTLSIGPGTYVMNNSLFVPSNVTVRGVPGQTILRKSRGVE